WKGKVYIVNEEQQLDEDDIGKKIGAVKRLANDHTGKYYGDASNIYPKGTAYHAIMGVATSKAIAVRVDSQWLKADYSRQAPFHIMNILTNIYFILIVFS